MKLLRIIILNGIAIFGIFFGLTSAVFADTVDHSNVGYIDGVSLNPDKMSYTVSGWACAKNYAGPIAVDLYFGGPHGVGAWYGRFQANQYSEPAVAAICQSTGSSYRFYILIDNNTAKAQVGNSIFIHGINPWNGQDGIMNTLISNSGSFTIPTLPVVQQDVRGYIESVNKQSNGSVVVGGWACVANSNASIQVDLYAGGPYGTGSSLGRFNANLFSDAGTAAACSASGSYYRFSIPVPLADAMKHAEKSVWIHGINPFDYTGASNLVIANSGNLSFPEIELIRDPLARTGVIPFVTSTIPYGEPALCKSNWIAAGKVVNTTPWRFTEIAELTYFCKNQGNAIPIASGKPIEYRSVDLPDMNGIMGPAKVLSLNPGTSGDPAPSIDFTFDTSKEWRSGCNLNLPDEGIDPEFKLGKEPGWSWPHFLMSQGIQNPEAPGTLLSLDRFKTITLGLSAKLVSSQKLSEGNCPSESWNIPNHEIFYVNVVLEHKTDVNLKGEKIKIYVLVPAFYSDDGINFTSGVGGIPGDDPIPGHATYFVQAPHPILELGKWVNFSINVHTIAIDAINAYKDKYKKPYTETDFMLSDFVMGFEVWGPYKAQVQVKNLSLKARLN